MSEHEKVYQRTEVRDKPRKRVSCPGRQGHSELFQAAEPEKTE